MKRSTQCLMIAVACMQTSAPNTSADYGEPRYKAPEGLVEGVAFMDLFLPLPADGNFRSDVWGGENVIPRNVDNGIEDDTYSYWGGNILRGDDGTFHMFVCRWPESSYKGEKKQGHALWWSSVVVHAVSGNPTGPYKVVEEIGRGHNPEVYRRTDGTYVIGVMGDRAVSAPSLDGPWTEIKASFTWLDEDKPLTEIMLLGIIAANRGDKIEWGSENMRITNRPELNHYLKEPIRKGWEYGEELWRG